MNNKCPKCGFGYMQKRPSAPDTDWICAKCGEPVIFNTPNKCVQRTACAWRKFLNFVGRVAGLIRRR